MNDGRARHATASRFRPPRQLRREKGADHGRAAASLAGLLAVLVLRGVASGQDAAGTDEPHPTVSADASWVVPMLWSVGGLFAAAATVGPLVWLRARSTVPPAATHEEDPAADRH